MSTDTHLRISKIGKTFKTASGAFEALRDVDLAIAKGEFVSVIGHSGCGKSTLLNIVAGLEPLNYGAASLDGEMIRGPGPERAVVFQNHSLLPWLSVYDNVRLAVDKVFGATRTAKERDDGERAGRMGAR